MSLPSSPPPSPEESPDVPGLRSWNGVYRTVIILFVLMVAALALLPALVS